MNQVLMRMENIDVIKVMSTALYIVWLCFNDRDKDKE